ncbi:MAG: hypothetical protein J0I06_05555 [Planctomycetes bacterium]|nr:hypothetical protein [Planctomycetota bacterium]
MPVLTCPKCPTKLKVPDGVSGNTRCPKCGTVFPVVKPAFEVVEDAPAPKPAPKIVPAPKTTSTPKTAPAPAPKPAPIQPDFEVVDEEPKKKRAAEDDDEDDRPRRKRRYEDDEDEDDRPRSRKRPRYDEDEDDGDDRPRKKKKKRYFDDNDYGDEWQPRPGAKGEYAKGRTGALLLGISFWMNMAAYGLLALYVLIAWLLSGEASSGSSSRGRSSGGDSDGSFLDVIVILPGLIGLGAWLVGLVGSSIAIAGPGKARGMTITATVFAGVHLILVGVTFSNMQEGLGSFGRSVPGLGKVAWIAVASTLPALDAFLPLLFYHSKSIGGDYVIALLAGACEAARLIFTLLALKALAAAARDYNASERSGYGVMIVSGVMGGVALLVLLVALVLEEAKFKSLNTYLNLGLGTLFLMYLGYALMMLSPALSAIATKNACDRRA